MKTCPECGAPIKFHGMSNLDGDEFMCGTVVVETSVNLYTDRSWACVKLKEQKMAFKLGIIDAAHLCSDYASKYLKEDRPERYVVACEIGNALINLSEKTK
jgi:hypothetical protein